MCGDKLLSFCKKLFYAVKDYKIIYNTSNEPLWEDETHKAFEECCGSGLEDFFYDCEVCGGTGKIKKHIKRFIILNLIQRVSSKFKRKKFKFLVH